MQLRIAETAPDSREAQHLIEAYFSSASPLGQRLERQHVESLVASVSGMNDVRSFVATDERFELMGLLFVERKPWEAQFFGCETVLVTPLIAEGDYTVRHEVASILLSHWKHQSIAAGRQYATTRVPSDDLAVIHALERSAFHLLVPTTTLEKCLVGQGTDFGELSMKVEHVHEQDIQALEEISRTAFLYGRYWVEPGLSKSVAGEMHATWVRNCCRGEQADTVLVAPSRGEPMGYIALRQQRLGETNLAVIILIATSSEARGRGIGRTLVHAGCAWASKQGATDIVVRTELPNIAALRLYEREGFTMASAGIYYGLWREASGG